MMNVDFDPFAVDVASLAFAQAQAAECPAVQLATEDDHELYGDAVTHVLVHEHSNTVFTLAPANDGECYVVEAVVGDEPSDGPSPVYRLNTSPEEMIAVLQQMIELHAALGSRFMLRASDEVLWRKLLSWYNLCVPDDNGDQGGCGTLLPHEGAMAVVLSDHGWVRVA